MANRDKVTQIYTHRLNPLKGWPNLAAVDVALPVLAGQDIVPGMICADNGAGKAKAGVSVGEMPLYCLLTGNRLGIDTDSTRYEGGFGNGVATQATPEGGSPAGSLAVGAIETGAKAGFLRGESTFEAESTELHVSVTAGTIAVNDALSAPAGVLKLAASGEAIIGYATKVGPYGDSHGTQVVAFVPVKGVAVAAA